MPGGNAMYKRVISLDIGGTFIKYGVVDSDGKIIYKNKKQTVEDRNDKMTIIKSAHKAISEIENMFTDTEAICISTSGQLNRVTGIMDNATGDFIDLIGFNLKEYFEGKFHKVVMGENDAKCAAIAERWMGAGRGIDEFIVITIGTGIGGGIFSRGKLFFGCGDGGEIGHFRMQHNGIPCTCGGTGCYERYASMKALIEQIKVSTGETMHGEEIFVRYKNGEEIVIPVVNQWLSYLVDGMISLIHILNPQRIIIGGGISEDQDIIKQIEFRLKQNAMKTYVENLEVVPAQTGNDAGMLGAAYLYLGLKNSTWEAKI